MNDFRIIGDIDRIGQRRFLGCLGRFVLVFLVSLLLLGAFAKYVQHRNLIAAAASVFAGFVFGYVASFLAPQARRVLAGAFALIPLVAFLGVFIAQVIIDTPKAPPFRFVIIPIFLSAGFLLGHRSASGER